MTWLLDGGIRWTVESPATMVLLKVTIAFLAGLVALRLAARARAAVRHAILAATFIVVLGLPLAFFGLPPVGVEVPVTVVPRDPASAGVSRAAGSSPAIQSQRNSVNVEPLAGWPALPSPATAGRLSWAVGTAIVLAWLIAAVFRVRMLRRDGLPWTDDGNPARGLAREAGVARPIEVLLHEGITAPLTCGVLRPAIILPLDAKEWSGPELRRAIVHELEHVRRADWWAHLFARAVCAIYWFHPLAWMAYRRLALEAERACDDAVVMREEHTDYAEQLVQLAQRMSARQRPVLAMAARSDLSARVGALLDSRQKRGRMSAVQLLSVALAASLLIAVGPVYFVAATTATMVAPSAAPDEQRPRLKRLDRALVEAADEGDLDGVSELIDGGADINVAVDGDGTPLIVAAREGHLDIVKLLLDRGADPNIPVSGDGNALIMAAREGYLPIVELLLDRGARIDEIVPGDENALIQASSEGHLDVVKLLVARGANVNTRVWVDGAYERPGGEWRTPLSQARREGRRAVIAYLESLGAR